MYYWDHYAIYCGFNVLAVYLDDTVAIADKKDLIWSRTIFKSIRNDEKCNIYSRGCTVVISPQRDKIKLHNVTDWTEWLLSHLKYYNMCTYALPASSSRRRTRLRVSNRIWCIPIFGDIERTLCTTRVWGSQIRANAIQRPKYIRYANTRVHKGDNCV